MPEDHVLSEPGTGAHRSMPALADDAPGVGQDVQVPFRSILFGAVEAPAHLDDLPDPACFGDLNLDQVVATAVSGRSEYRLEGYYRLPLTDVDQVMYRHEVFLDLRRERVLGSVTDFAEAMERVRERLALAEKRYHPHEKARWFLDAALVYADAVPRLVSDLEDSQPESRGLRGLLSSAIAYTGSDRFARMRESAVRVRSALDGIRYDVWLHGARVTVGLYDDERNYSLEVARTFARFEQHPIDAVTEHDGSGGDLDPVEGRILDQVAQVFPEPFADLDDFTRRARFLHRPARGRLRPRGPLLPGLPRPDPAAAPEAGLPLRPARRQYGHDKRENVERRIRHRSRGRSSLPPGTRWSPTTCACPGPNASW